MKRHFAILGAALTAIVLTSGVASAKDYSQTSEYAQQKQNKSIYHQIAEQAIRRRNARRRARYRQSQRHPSVYMRIYNYGLAASNRCSSGYSQSCYEYRRANQTLNNWCANGDSYACRFRTGFDVNEWTNIRGGLGNF
ncbi:MAG: hypothetical protein QNJ63_05690 [Calothrix sp. MO_192.B10]|nr:hypothetical protein [Calothrix sp. MO_192.B10]